MRVNNYIYNRDYDSGVDNTEILSDFLQKKADLLICSPEKHSPKIAYEYKCKHYLRFIDLGVIRNDGFLVDALTAKKLCHVEIKSRNSMTYETYIKKREWGILQVRPILFMCVIDNEIKRIILCKREHIQPLKSYNTIEEIQAIDSSAPCWNCNFKKGQIIYESKNDKNMLFMISADENGENNIIRHRIITYLNGQKCQ